MRTETSKQPENSSSQISIEITEGKRKRESHREEMSLQDVFSESGNASGSSQKTSLPSDTERRKGTQLKRKSKRKSSGGRRRLERNEKRIIKLQMHVTAKEYEKLNDQFRATGIRYFSEYLRILILDKGRPGNITNKQELIKQLDTIGSQISKIGNNINQVAKYANIQIKTNKVDHRTIERFNEQMEAYLQEERNLINTYRALARNK